MWISELFHSIQGEGLLSGVPSVFIRASGCNLRCAWCDTPYTSWRAEGAHHTLDQIMDYVIEHTSGHVVVTGGEPMIAPEIYALTCRLKEAGQHITIETAGTVATPVVCDLMSISPKLANSAPVNDPDWAARHEQLRYQPNVLRQLVAQYRYQLKFVVQGERDIAEVNQMVAEIGAAKDRVLLMPEGVDAEAMSKTAGPVAELCKREGYRYCARLHVYLYGNRRGT